MGCRHSGWREEEEEGGGGVKAKQRMRVKRVKKEEKLTLCTQSCTAVKS